MWIQQQNNGSNDNRSGTNDNGFGSNDNGFGSNNNNGSNDNGLMTRDLDPTTTDQDPTTMDLDPTTVDLDPTTSKFRIRYLHCLLCLVFQDLFTEPYRTMFHKNTIDLIQCQWIFQLKLFLFPAFVWSLSLSSKLWVSKPTPFFFFYWWKDGSRVEEVSQPRNWPLVSSINIHTHPHIEYPPKIYILILDMHYLYQARSDFHQHKNMKFFQSS